MEIRVPIAALLGSCLAAAATGCGNADGVISSPVGVVDLFSPTDGQGCSQAMGISNAGMVVGFSSSCADTPWPNTYMAYPFIADASGVHRLATPVPDEAVYGYAANDHGYIIANGYRTATNAFTQYLYRPNRWATPDVLPLPGGGDSYALTVERPPMIAGAIIEPAGWRWFRHEAASGATRETVVVQPPASGFQGNGGAMAINGSGDLAGFYTLVGGARAALAWTEDRGLVRLDALVPEGSGWKFEMAVGINMRRQVVGFGELAGIHRSFRLNLDDGAVVDLGTLPPPDGDLAVTATAINSNGFVVGSAGAPADGHGYHLHAQRAFIYTDATGLMDLNTLVTLPAGWILREATAINDHNQVAGFASDEAGVRHAFRVRIDVIAADGGAVRL